jgi:hypothetical protein
MCEVAMEEAEVLAEDEEDMVGETTTPPKAKNKN